MRRQAIQTLPSWKVRHDAHWLLVRFDMNDFSEVREKRAQMDKGIHIGSWGQLQGEVNLVILTQLRSSDDIHLRMEGRHGFAHRYPSTSITSYRTIPWLCHHFL